MIGGLFTADMLAKATVEILPGQYRPEDVRVYVEKIDGKWLAVAFVDQNRVRVVLAISHGQSRSHATSDAMNKATERVTVKMH